MCELRIKRLNEGTFSVPFTLIKRAIDYGLNITVYYRTKQMQLSWEKLASKFGHYEESPMGFEEWEFQFNPDPPKTGVKI